jgi:ubiquinone/menaquinone biosynthesis C-methylase UbiE
MNTVRPFNKYTDRYEEWFNHYPFAYESELIAISKLLPMKGKGLEIGVGTGRFAQPLGIKLGIEPSLSMAVHAQQRGVKLALGIGESLPLKNACLDAVLIVTTICFFENPSQALTEAARVLRPGGFIVIGLVNRTSKLGLIYLKNKNNNVFYREATFYSVEEVIEMLIKAGFQDFSFTQTIFNKLDDIIVVEPALNGFDKGSFIGIKGIKPDRL